MIIVSPCISEYRVQLTLNVLMQWHWQRLWDVLTGDVQTQPLHEVPILASVFFYSLTVFLGRLLRGAAHQWAPARLCPYLCDAVTTFQLLACSLENGQLRLHYGNGAYLCVLCVVGLYSVLTIQDGSSANPTSHLVRYMHGQEPRPWRAGLRVLCQLAGGLLSYQYARLFWRLGLTASHSSRSSQLYCLTDLKVPLALGLCLEYAGTLFDHLLHTNTFSKFHNTEMLFKCLFGSYLTLLNVDMTGWYLNPLNATNQTFGCLGRAVWEQVLVYWGGPMAGVVTGVWLQRRLEHWRVGRGTQGYPGHQTHHEQAIEQGYTSDHNKHQ